MLICADCNNTFEDPRIRTDLLTVVDHRPYREEVAVCPFCGSEDIDDAELCPMCDEYRHEDEMVDLSDYNTHIGEKYTRVCKYCMEDAGEVE